MNCVEAAQQTMERLGPLPETALRALQIVGDARSSTDDLLTLLRRDTALTARILRLSNSSTHDAPREIVDVSQAVAYLGGRTLVHMVIGLCLSPCYNHAGDNSLDKSELWRHAIASGLATELLAEAKGVADASYAFTAGLLHNIGRLVLLPWTTRHAEALRSTAALRPRGYLDAEREVLGLDHMAAGGMLAERWQIPLSFRQAIRNHHCPELVTVDEELTALVHLADALVMQLGIGLGFEGLGYPVSIDALRRFHVRAEELDRIRLLLLDEFGRAELLTQMVLPPGRGET